MHRRWMIVFVYVASLVGYHNLQNFWHTFFGSCLAHATVMARLVLTLVLYSIFIRQFFTKVRLINC
jgi:hypothetical protein